MKKLLPYILGLVGLAVAVLIAVRMLPHRQPGLNQAPPSSSSPSQPVKAPDEYTPNPDLEASYEVALKKILADFAAGTATAGATRDLVLEQTVPDKYKTLHLELAIVFEKIMTGQMAQDQAMIEGALEELDSIKRKNQWLGL